MNEPDASASRRSLRPHHHVAVVLLAGLLMIVLINLPTAQAPHQTTEAAAILPGQPTAAAAAALVAESEQSTLQPNAAPVDIATSNPRLSQDLRSRLLGSWEDNFYGKRVFTFHADGTAQMTLELDGVGKLMYGPKLTFYIQWSLTDDVLKMTMSGGEPQETTTTLAKLFGETSEQKIEQISDAALQLRSLDSQKLYQHVRVPITPISQAERVPREIE